MLSIKKKILSNFYKEQITVGFIFQHKFFCSQRMSAILASGVAIAKSLTCRLMLTCLPLMEPECKHDSCTVGCKPNSHKIVSVCFSHNLGASGCLCMADNMGITCPGGIGGCFFMFHPPIKECPIQVNVEALFLRWCFR
jgi:hypothetical protein